MEQACNLIDKSAGCENSYGVIVGMEKDPGLVRYAKSSLHRAGGEAFDIFKEDALDPPSLWQPAAREKARLGTFDVALVHPPIGKNVKVEGADRLEQFSLTPRDRKSTLKKTGNVCALFMERGFQFLKNGGRIGIILPESYLALKSYARCRDFMFGENNVIWVIDLPHNTFRPHSNAKCCAIIIAKGKEQQKHINMAVAQNIGHDHKGKPIYRPDGSINDDMPQIIDEISRNRNNDDSFYPNSLTFKVNADVARKSGIMIPRFYRPGKLHSMENNWVSLQKLVDEGIITHFDGHGSPSSDLKGKGVVPYIRVKDIVDWQVYVDVTALIPRSEYERLFNPAKRLIAKDILYVRRGSYRIGSVAMVSPHDGEMLIAREITVIRVINEDNRYGLTPEYLLYALSYKNIREQTMRKVFYEPCLPNIGDRWKELLIPIPKNVDAFERIKKTVECAVENQWKSREGVNILKRDFDVFMV